MRFGFGFGAGRLDGSLFSWSGQGGGSRAWGCWLRIPSPTDAFVVERVGAKRRKRANSHDEVNSESWATLGWV